MPQADDGWSRRPVWAGILVGGGSTRMGEPKALLRGGGLTFVERIMMAVLARIEQVVVLGDSPLPPTLHGVTQLSDVPGLAGPLAGMLAAMRWAPETCWVMIACDLPLLRSEAVDWLLEQRGPDRRAVLPRLSAQRVEPLLAVYEPKSRELLEKLVAAGLRSPHSLAGQPRVYSPTPPEALRRCWTNVNTPEELLAIANLVDEPR